MKASRKHRVNLDTIINDMLSPSTRAFPESAIIVQQKRFPDVSFYQGIIDFDMMSSKTNAIIIRAGQNLWIDEQFKRSWLEAKQRSMKRGSYWFYDDRVSPGAQADLWNSLLTSDKPEMEIWVDWENTYNGSFRGLNNVIAMMQRMESFSYKVGLYTGYYWFRGNSNAITNAAQYNYLKTHPLWLAWYTSNANDVLIPAPFTSLLLWQFGTPALGLQHGAGTLEIDMNYINMTEAEFQIRYDIMPSNGDSTMDVHKLTVLASGLNIRTNAGTNYPILVPSGLLKNDMIESSTRTPLADGTIWYKIDKITRGTTNITTGLGGWASAGLTNNYMRLDSTQSQPSTTIEYPTSVTVNYTDPTKSRDYFPE